MKCIEDMILLFDILVCHMMGYWKSVRILCTHLNLRRTF